MSLGYIQQHNSLLKKGHTDIKRNLKLLIRFNGDESKVIEQLVLKKLKIDQKTESLEKYKQQIDTLQQNGFDVANKHFIVKLLNKVDGDVNKAEQRLNEKINKKRLDKETLTKGEKIAKHDDEIKNDQAFQDALALLK